MKYNLILVLVLFCTTQTHAQTTSRAYNTNSEAYQLFHTIPKGDSMVFSYSETPGFCYNGRKNHLSGLTSSQEVILETFEYPHFVSYGINSVERDIWRFKQAVARWEKENEYRAPQIRQELGFSK